MKAKSTVMENAASTPSPTNRKIELSRYIRFQLEQMSARNDQHLFEQLSFELARLRVASNVIPATGPVQAGGDQGRDFESYVTYLGTTDIADSTFAARASDTTIAFACTLDKKLPKKIRNDLKKIFGSGEKPDAVYYFAAPDMPVSNRHELQDHCRSTYGARLTVFDGQAIADMLCDPDTFWIAQEFLSVPAEMFPPVETDPEYSELRQKWIGASRKIQTPADFLEVKRALRKATFSANHKVDLGGWIERMRTVLPDETSPFYRRALYEIAVAQLRGRGNLDPEAKSVATYFRTLPAELFLDELEDAVTLITYVRTAARLGHFSGGEELTRTWLTQVEDAVDAGLDGPPQSDLNQFVLLQGRAQIDFLRLVETADESFAKRWMRAWRQAFDLAKRNVLIDADKFAERLEAAVPAVGTRRDFQKLADELDALVAKRSSKARAAELARNRAIAHYKAGQIIDAVDQLQRAKEGWFAAETMRGSILAMLLLSDLYSALRLPLAARLYASAALLASLKASDENLRKYSAAAAFATAGTFLQTGEPLSYLACLRDAYILHGQFMPDPGDVERHTAFTGSLAQVARIQNVMEKCVPAVTPIIEQLITALPLHDDFREMIAQLRQDDPLAATDASSLRALVAEQTGQPLDNDIGNLYEMRWRALGITWTVRAKMNERLAAEALIAVLQIVQVDLAGTDLLIVPSDVELDLALGGTTKPTITRKHQNDSLLWDVVCPRDWMETSEKGDVDFTMQVALLALLETSALEEERFITVLKMRAARGLLNRAFWLRPPGRLLLEARNMAELPGDAEAQSKIGADRPVPLEAEQLAWRDTPAPGYSRAQAERFLGRRYKATSTLARQIVPRAIADPRVRLILQKLHEDGLLDWQIYQILFSFAVQQSIERMLGERLTIGNHPQAKRLMGERARMIEEKGYPEFDLSELKPEMIETGQKMSVMAVAKTWGLVNHRESPDFEAWLKLLNARFQNATDDIPHENLFRWDER